jgi:hypothetical protein
MRDEDGRGEMPARRGSAMNRVTGVVRDGIVVLDEPLDVPDGTHVIVEVPARDWILRFAGVWKDDVGIDEWVQERREGRSMSEGKSL